MIFKKVFTTFVSTILIVTIILGIIMFYFLGNYLVEQKKYALINTGERISSVTSQMINYNEKEFKSYFNILSEFTSKNMNSDVFLIDRNGKVISYSYSVQNNYIYELPKDVLNEVNSGKKIAIVTKINGLKDSTLIAGVPVMVGNEIIGGVYLLTLLPEMTRLRQDVIKIYLFSAIFVFLISIILTLIIIKKVTDPIKALKIASKKIGSGDFKTRVKIYNKDDEIGQLAEQFNNMAESIEKSEYMRRVFISDVSHELRTPMTIITGFVEGILDDTIEEEKQKEYLAIVLEESKRLSKLVSDLLDISRIESSEVKLDEIKFDINELIRLSVIGFEKRLNEKHLSVDVTFENETEEVFAEKDSIKRVLTNLLDNAIKFSYDNSTICIVTKQKGKKVYVSIKNQGAGISKDEQKTIFERFYKLDKSRSQNKGGVGLGLYIVKRIINKHGEKIWINSEENEYAEFIFTLKK